MGLLLLPLLICSILYNLFVGVFIMGNVLTLFYTAVGLVIFGNRFRNIQEIAKCYDKSKFNLETRSRDAIKDIMDLGFSYWESVLAIGVGMKIININDFNHKEE